MNLEEKLWEHFKFTSFRNGQKETIHSILNNNHTLAMLPTGTGKSLCYQFPGKFLDGAIIIVSPLLSLMQDQVEQMKMNGEKRVVALNSFLSRVEKKYALEHLKKYKYIYISPEMIQLPFVLNKLQELQISLFVVDEAHCIAQWGYDFRPEYQNLGSIRIALGSPLTLALTATATKEIRKDIVDSLCLEDVTEIIYSINRPNIALSVEQLSNPQQKIKRLEELVVNLDGPGIIYFSSKKLAEHLTSYLKEKSDKKIMVYHGGMLAEERMLVQQQFLLGQLDIICATSAFGMGINKNNIRYVIHFHMPTQMESYLQEIGRAGRDGLSSLAILLYIPGDEMLSYQLVEMEHVNDRLLFQWEQSLRIYSTFQEWLELENGWLLNNLSEIQWRVLEAYIKPGNKKVIEIVDDIHSYQKFREERLKIKNDKINEILAWIHLTTCRRTFLTNYYKEKEPTLVENCCDVCGLKMEPFYREKGIKIDREQSSDWKNRLANILQIKGVH